MSDDTETRTTRLVLIRHGESIVTVKRTIGGVRSCVGLSDLGRRQAERLRERFSRGDDIEPDVLLSSDFQRAIETAEIIRPAFGPALAEREFEQLAGLGEHDPGPDIDGMTFAAYVERFGTPDWSGDPNVEIFPGGETTFEFHRRVHTAIGEVLERHAGSSIVVSCHGGVVDAVFRHLLGLPITGGFELQALNTSITEFVSTNSEQWRLVRYNDAAHLAGLPEATPRA
jgi:2,3-bisphosphoglycerate-dependent phosphoglycerate mutase